MDDAHMNFSWVEGGQVAGCRGPRSDADLAFLRAHGLGALVRLAFESQTGLTEEQVRRAGIEDCYEPTEDFTAPTQDQLTRIIRFILSAKSRGVPVAVSCGAGCGRTGTALACYVVATGRSAADAIEHLVDARPCSHEVLEIPEQRRAVRDFEHRLFVDLVCLVYHEARNARRPEIRNRPLANALHDRLPSKHGDKYGDWRTMEPVRVAAYGTKSAHEVEQVFLEHYPVGIDELERLFDSACWTRLDGHCSFGGPKWAEICRRTMALARALDGSDGTTISESLSLLLDTEHNSHGPGGVRSKLYGLWLRQ